MTRSEIIDSLISLAVKEPVTEGKRYKIGTDGEVEVGVRQVPIDAEIYRDRLLQKFEAAKQGEK